MAQYLIEEALVYRLELEETLAQRGRDFDQANAAAVADTAADIHRLLASGG